MKVFTVIYQTLVLQIATFDIDLEIQPLNQKLVFCFVFVSTEGWSQLLLHINFVILQKCKISRHGNFHASTKNRSEKMEEEDEHLIKTIRKARNSDIVVLDQKAHLDT